VETPLLLLFHGVSVQLVHVGFGHLAGLNHFAEYVADCGLIRFHPLPESLLKIFSHA
jgi:hypothetical protein